MEAFGFRSVQSAREHLEALVKEGRLDKDKGKARGYRLPYDSGSYGTLQLVPLLGRVTAGALDIAAEDYEGYIPIRSRHPSDELFALRVRGESMTGAGIYPDDVVVVRRQPTAETGEIVVALVGDEATVKRLRIRGMRLELHPENPEFEVIVPDVTRFSLLGKVVELHRYLERS
jgi:repressor LexA